MKYISSAKTIEQQLSSGTQITPEVIKELGNQIHSKTKDLRRGILLISFALAIFAFAQIVEFPTRGNLNLSDAIVGIAQIPGFLGLAFLILHFLESRR